MTDWRHHEDEWRDDCNLIRWEDGDIRLDFELCRCGTLFDLVYNYRAEAVKGRRDVILPKNWIPA